MSTPLSVVINTKNAADTLRNALQSVKWVDEIVVVDMLSTDHTKKIAKQFTKQIFEFTEDVSYADPARNFAFSKAKNKWVLVVDADEVVPTALKKKIIALLSQEPDVACYYIARKNIIFGKWIEKTGWWPDYQPRLFQRSKLTWRDEVHSQPIIEGQVEYLPATEELAIEHHNYRSVSDYLSRLDRYTSIAAEEKPSSEVITPTSLIDSFRSELMSRLFADQGIEEGVHGVSLSFLQSMYQFVTKLKQWELQGSPTTEETPQQTMAAVEQLQQDIAYWKASYKQRQSRGVTSAWWRLRKKAKR